MLVDHNLFYWFFKHDNALTPLLIWINGGPGSSSMFGLFLENGPLRIVETGNATNEFEIRAAEEAWTDTYNVLYLDQPVGTGFSWGDSLITDEATTSQEFINFLRLFI